MGWRKGGYRELERELECETLYEPVCQASLQTGTNRRAVLRIGERIDDRVGDDHGGGGARWGAGPHAADPRRQNERGAKKCCGGTRRRSARRIERAIRPVAAEPGIHEPAAEDGGIPAISEQPRTQVERIRDPADGAGMDPT